MNEPAAAPEQDSPGRRLGKAASPDGSPRSGGLRQVLVAAALVSIGCVVLILSAVWITRPADVLVIEVVPGRLEKSLSVVGRVQPRQIVDIRPPNAGQVLDLLADDGEIVENGAILAVLQAVIEDAQSEAIAAREQAAGAELARAAQAFARTEHLAEKGIAAQAALDDAQAVLKIAEAQLATAAAERRAAEARAREFVLRAPMTGIVLIRSVDNGQLVSPETSLFRLASVGNVELEAEVDEIYADDIRAGLPARAALSGSDLRFAATVSEVSLQVNPATGGRLIKLAPDEAADLPSGRSVDITIIVSERPDGIALPRQALMDPSTRPRVHIVDTQGVVSSREVRIDRWPSVKAIIDGGLKAGDLVILDPAPGQISARVRPRPVSGERAPVTGE